MDWQPHADANYCSLYFFPTSGGGGQGWGREREGTPSLGGPPRPVFDCLVDIFAKTPLVEVRLAVLGWRGSLAGIWTVL